MRWNVVCILWNGCRHFDLRNNLKISNNLAFQTSSNSEKMIQSVRSFLQLQTAWNPLAVHPRFHKITAPQTYNCVLWYKSRFCYMWKRQKRHPFRDAWIWLTKLLIWCVEKANLPLVTASAFSKLILRTVNCEVWYVFNLAAIISGCKFTLLIVKKNWYV